MNYTNGRNYRHLFGRLLLGATSLLFAAALAGLTARAADTGAGTISGSVTSKGTHNALQGALVNIPALNRSGFTDESGRFSIGGVPTGAYEVVVTYSGFNEARQKVSVGTGGIASLDLALESSDTITMAPFTVESVKEGRALSLTEQRNAANVKNVVAFDEWGILPTQNVGELATRLPGITWTTDEDQLINNVSIGGQPTSYTRLNIDGMSSTGVGGDGRTATLHSFSGAMYEQIEIIAGQTPDKRADSLGGQLNLKTRSPLAMSEHRRIGYTLSGRYFPSWSKRNFAVAERPLKPDFFASYTEVFSVLGGHRNLGIAVTASYQEVLNPHNWDVLLYENTTNPLAQLRDYTKQSGLNDRFLSAISARADYRISPSTTASLRFLYNAGSEPFFSYTAMNPWASANLTVYDPTTNPNGSILPGYTADRIEFRPTSTNVTVNIAPVGSPAQNITTATGAAQMRMNPQRYSFTSKNPTGTLVFEHNWGRLKVDHAYRWSNTHWDSGAGRQREDGTIALRTRDPIGFILDKSNLDGKVFTWTTGANPYDIRSYTPYYSGSVSATQPVPQTNVVFNKRDTITDTNEVSATANASYTLATEIPITLKTGLDTVNRRVNSRQVYPRRWYQIPGTFLPTTGLMPMTEFEIQNGGLRLPVLDPAAISKTLSDTSLWYEDTNFTATSRYTGRYIFEEGVDASYLQSTAKLGRLTVLGGVRGERVRTHTFTYFRARTTPFATEPDNFKRAALDYGSEKASGSYSKFFPSVHLAYDFTSNLKARASWSNSYGRPSRQQVIPTPTITDPNSTYPTGAVTIGNPALKPQVATNVDLKLEYYFNKGSDTISVRGYRKHIKDYISTATRSGILVGKGNDNGFDGQYEGYEVIQAGNTGDATLKGFEADYRQRLAFLPGALKGLIVRGNFTYLQTFGKFAGTTDLKNGQVAGFIPRAYNVGLLYTYRKFSASYDVNYTGKYPVAYSATAGNANGNLYRKDITIMNVGVSYKVRSEATVFLNVNNIDQQGQEQYTFDPSRHRQQWIVGRSIKFGVTGQF